jgi:hypothetical protein
MGSSSIADVLEDPYADPELLVERLVPWEYQEKGLLWKEAREVAEVYVGKSKSLPELVKRLEHASATERFLVKHEALQFVRIRAEALMVVFSS